MSSVMEDIPIRMPTTELLSEGGTREVVREIALGVTEMKPERR